MNISIKTPLIGDSTKFVPQRHLKLSASSGVVRGLLDAGIETIIEIFENTTA